MAANPNDIPERLLDPATNPYKAQRLWPPDFSKMDPKHQFRLERRYRRRAKMTYLRPGWVRGIKFAQYSISMRRYCPFPPYTMIAYPSSCLGLWYFLHGLEKSWRALP
jgi:hypothetical protein